MKSNTFENATLPSTRAVFDKNIFFQMCPISCSQKFFLITCCLRSPWTPAPTQRRALLVVITRLGIIIFSYWTNEVKAYHKIYLTSIQITFDWVKMCMVQYERHFLSYGWAFSIVVQDILILSKLSKKYSVLLPIQIANAGEYSLGWTD